MRKVSVLSLASIVAAVGLMVSPAFGAAIVGGDLPDISVPVGEQATDVIDLNQFFESPAGEEVTYAVAPEGAAEVNNGVLTVFGSETEGVSEITITATAGGESVDRTFTVFSNSFAVENGPAVDNNNRVAGALGGNVFFNGIVPGETVNSVEALGLPEIGGGSPGGVSAAALITTIAEVTLDETQPPMTRRQIGSATVGADGVASAAGLTVTLNEDGTYSLATTSEFSGAYLVTLGASVGDNADAVALLAASATAVELSETNLLVVPPSGATEAAPVSFDGGVVTVTAAPGTGALLISNSPVTVGDAVAVTLSADVNASAAANVAVVGFDGGIGASLTYTNPGGPNLEAGQDMNISTVMTPMTETVQPGMQVFNSGTAEVTVTISALNVVMAGALTEYAVNPSAKAALPVSGSISDDLAGWGSDIRQIGASAPTKSDANNFAAADGSGSLQLDATAAADAVAQGFVQVTVEEGTVVAECYVQNVGETAGVFALVYTDGASNDMGAFIAGDLIPATWKLVQVSSTIQGGTTGFFVVQAANGLNAQVDDVAVRVVNDNDAWFDSALLGM